MANITIDDEKALRANLKTFLEASPILGKIHTRRRRIKSREDFVSKFGVVVAAAGPNKIVRFCEIEFLKFEDSPDEGFDDCPIAAITYGLHLFHEFFDGTDDANSNDDFIASILEIRRRFLSTQEFAAVTFEVESNPVTMPGFASFGNDSFTDCQGHVADLNLIARFYDE